VKIEFLVVTSPVANLRKEPVEASCKYTCDDLQETQLLYNECLLYKEENEDWYYVQAVEQQKATPAGDWQGYPGWIRKTSAIVIDARPVLNAVVKHAQAIILKDPPGKAESLLTLSIGTRLVIEDGENDDYHKTTLIDGRRGWIKKGDVNIPAPAMDIASLRKKILETTKLFLGMPYLWGGRSACVPQDMAHGAKGIAQRGKGTKQGVQKEEGRWEREADSLGPNSQPRTSNIEPAATPPLLHRRTGTPEDRLRTVSGVVTGVDCSSLTHLAYRVNWLDIPRDAHDQWSASAHITCDTLCPADLIFVSAEDTHDKITHVMMYLAGEEFIEALETGSVVTINTFKNKFGITLRDAAQHGFIVNKRKMYFGSILIAGEKKWVL
jgi:cell wall-associated NlpC family hydrolase